jgi:rhodanese-related sulfurtransferase
MMGFMEIPDSTHPTVPSVSRDALVEALRARRVTLVDVLPPESFSSAHLPGAINLPVADIPRLASATLPDRDQAIIVYCGGPT